MKRAVLAILGVALAGCQTTADYEAGVARSYVGQTMADFTVRTGLVPSSIERTPTGRIFLVDGPVISVATPMAYGSTITNTQACRVFVETRRVSEADNADSWQIVNLTWTGPCQTVL